MTNYLKILKKMNKSKRGQVIFFVISMVVIVLVYSMAISWVKDKRNEKLLLSHEVVTDNDILTSVDDIQKTDKLMTISGWGIRLNSRNISMKVMLKATDGSHAIMLPTEMVSRKEVGEYFVPGWNFGQCGFLSNVKRKELKENVCYEMFLIMYYDEMSITGDSIESTNSKKISLNQYLYNEEIYCYNIESFERPEITDVEVMQIMDNGILRAYDMEKKIWVYQQDTYLYIISDLGKESLKESRLGCPVLPYTSIVESLPEERIPIGYDHIGSFYEEEVYRREGVLPYQIVKIPLPSDYPITRIDTGIYDGNKQEWVRHFRIYVADRYYWFQD